MIKNHNILIWLRVEEYQKYLLNQVQAAANMEIEGNAENSIELQ